MFGSNRSVAFVGSTLPYQKVKNLIRAGKVKHVVCSTLNLYQAFVTGFGYDRLEIKIAYLSENRFLNFLQLLKWVLFSSDTYIYHECYWRNLDLLLLIFKKKVIYSPDIGMEGRKLIYPVTIKSVGLKSIIFKKYFDYYRSMDDPIMSGEVILALKSKYRKSTKNLLEDGIPKKNSEICPLIKKKALIIMGVEGAENHLQGQIFLSIALRLIEKGYEVDIKDHPNEDFRLGFHYPGTNYINPLLPADCLVGNNYKVVIGFSSAALAFNWNAHVLTIAKLLPKECKELIDLRLAHLSSLKFNFITLRNILDIEFYI